jgi:WD40 repeat protein
MFTIIPRSARLLGAALTLFVLTACLFTAASAQITGYASTDFILTEFASGRLAVYDQNFAFKGYLDNSFSNPTGLDLLPNGNLVATGYGQDVRTYDRNGNTLSQFSSSQLGAPVDLKVSGGMLYVGTQYNTHSAAEFTSAGTFMRSFAAKEYQGIAVLPGGVLWAGSEYYPGTIEVFDLATGNVTDTINLDNGQIAVTSMHYSPATNTVFTTNSEGILLTAAGGYGAVYERSTSGAFVRVFVAPYSFTSYGVTRGPNGNVYATDYSNNRVVYWDANGIYLGEFPTLGNAYNLVWAGNALAPTAANVAIAGKIFNNYGRGLSNATVTLTDSRGAVRSVRTNSFGNFRFEDITAGENCVLAAAAKGYRFDPQIVTANEELTTVNFTPQSSVKAGIAARKSK